MACRYYDDLIVAKIQHWIPTASPLRVLKPDESKRLFELTASDTKDQPFKLPIIAISRSNDIELLSTVKSPKSYDGLRIIDNKVEASKKADDEPAGVFQFNVIPIKLEYQLDIYTKTYEECDEYVRNFLFKLINNPVIKIVIPYNDSNIEHIANIRVLSTVSDTSDIGERIFSGQFTRYSIQLELQDAFLFSIPYRNNWHLYISDDEEAKYNNSGVLEIVDKDTKIVEKERLDFYIKKT